jgi:hypothetical protein
MSKRRKSLIVKRSILIAGRKTGVSVEDVVSESLARKVVASSALASPSADVIRLANDADFISGKRATVVSVGFSVEEDSITSAAARGGRGEGKVEMTDQKPWRLEDLAFESMGDD